MSPETGQSRQAVTQVTRWTIDPAHSEVGFAVKHMMVSTVRGRFSDVAGTIEFDEANPEATKIVAEIDATSIDTRNEQRDNHLRSPDFFGTETHRKITFVSKRVEKTGDNQFKVTGDLTIRGVTREVVLDATYEGTHPDPWGGVRAGFSATTSINRHDFGVSWNQAIESGGVVVGDTVKITLEIEAVKEQ